MNGIGKRMLWFRNKTEDVLFLFGSAYYFWGISPALLKVTMSKNYLNELQLEQASPAFALIHWGLNQNFF